MVQFRMYHCTQTQINIVTPIRTPLIISNNITIKKIRLRIKKLVTCIMTLFLDQNWPKYTPLGQQETWLSLTNRASAVHTK